jgi:hypothetical protein
MTLYCPGRTTFTHNQFLADFAGLSEMKFLVLDAASADLAYASGSKNLVLCSNERYHLELHKFLTIAPAYRYIRESWENKFECGRGWKQRGKFLAAFNNLYRPKVMRTWDDMSQYYCVLAMSGFRTSYQRGNLVGEHTPITPNYDSIREWSRSRRDKTVRYCKRNIYNYPTSEIDNNTVIYSHIPNNFATYGYGYVWTRRRLENASREFSDLARLGQRVVISMSHSRWDKKNSDIEDLFPDDLFRTLHYTELKAKGLGFTSRPVTEVYLVANLGQ